MLQKRSILHSSKFNFFARSAKYRQDAKLFWLNTISTCTAKLFHDELNFSCNIKMPIFDLFAVGMFAEFGDPVLFLLLRHLMIICFFWRCAIPKSNEEEISVPQLLMQLSKFMHFSSRADICFSFGTS